MEAKRELKIAVIGVGERGANLGGAAYECAHLVAVCDRDPEVLEKCKAYYAQYHLEGVQFFTSYEEMFAKVAIDAVIVATPMQTHADIAVTCLNAGKHVFCEIPLFNTKEEAVRLYRTLAAHPDLCLTTAENCCFFGFIRSWKEMVEKNKIGRVIFGEAEYLHGSGHCPPAGTWRSSMACLRYLTHSLGPLLYITGDSCTEVSGFAPDFNPYPEARKMPNGMAVIKTKNGALFKVYMGFGGFFPCTHNYALHGTAGALQTQVNLENDDKDDCRTFAHLMEFDEIVNMHGKGGIYLPFNLNNSNEPRKAGTHGDCDITLIRAFRDAVLDKTPAPLGFDFGYNVTMPGLLAEESAAAGGVPVRIPTIEELDAEYGK